jgi:hypothetical protein
MNQLSTYLLQNFTSAVNIHRQNEINCRLGPHHIINFDTNVAIKRYYDSLWPKFSIGCKTVVCRVLRGS